MLTFFYSPGSCALASHIALEDAGASYELKRVDFRKTEQQSPDYLAVNPKGRVPALATPLGAVTENPAILAFIAVWRQDRMAARLFAPTPPGRPLPLR